MHGDRVADDAATRRSLPREGADLPRAEAFQIDLIRTKINLLPEGIREVRPWRSWLDLQADGGTRCHHREVGSIRVTDYKSKGAINKRIYIEVG
jgi:misacylated tRNA(Ala) deacylase